MKFIQLTLSITSKKIALRPERIISVEEFNQPRTPKGQEVHKHTQSVVVYQIDNVRTPYQSEQSFKMETMAYYINEPIAIVLNRIENSH